MANRSLARREAQVRAQKIMIAFTIIFLIAVGILFGTCVHVFAGDNEAQALQKHYTSIRIEDGDTLWDIAGKYVQNTEITRQEYIKEVCELNGLNADEIIAGEYIVVVYYEMDR